MDPATLVTLSAALGKAVDPVAKEGAAVGGRLLENLFGPLTVELGLLLRDRVHSRFVVDVVKRTERKSRPLHSGGAIPLRVVKGVLDAAEVAENELVAEYLSGVLASARTPGGVDDSGVIWTGLIQRMSAAQLRLHYGLCMLVRRLSLASGASMFERVAIPVAPLKQYMGTLWINDIAVLEAVYGLRADSIVESRVVHGSTAQVENEFAEMYDFQQGFDSWWVLSLSVRGAQLFLNAFGYGGEWVDALVDPEHDFRVPESDGVRVEALVGYFLEDLPRLEKGRHDC